MCTLHLFFRVFPEAPVLLAANRDELLDRPWDPPGRLLSAPAVFGPRDALAGGTWLGVNEFGLVAALANHLGTLSAARPTSLCTRGAVVLEALRHPTARAARNHAEQTAPACKAYTLLLADPGQAFVVDRNPRGSRTHELAAGCHVVTNTRFRQPGDRKAARSLGRMRELVLRGATPSAEELSSFLADHERPSRRTTPLCIHLPPPSRFGTSSASAVEVAADGHLRKFLFAAGPPCTTPFADVTPALNEAAVGPVLPPEP